VKKFHLIFLTFFLIIGFSYSQTITINSPDSGNVWHKGKTYVIKWVRNGSMNSKVKIRLYQGSKKILSIVNSTPNDGSFIWKIPESLEDGIYVIRVKTVDNKVFDNSDSFKIVKSLSFGSIKVISPNKNSVWMKGGKYAIKWVKNGSMNSKVKIRLYQGSRKVLSIINSTPNNGFYLWNVPLNLRKGKYVVRVKTIDNKEYDDSDYFIIFNDSSNSSGLMVLNGNQPQMETLKTYDNNVLQPASNLLQSKPDLKIVKMEVVPKTPISNHPFSVKMTVINTGWSIPKNKSFYTYVFDSNGEIPAARAVKLIGLKRGEQATLEFDNIIYPKGGNYVLKAMVDSSRVISEENENNNTSFLKINIAQSYTKMDSNIYFENTRDNSVWVNCGQNPPLIYYKFDNTVKGRIYDKNTGKNWVVFNGKRDINIGSFQIHDNYRNITVEMESIDKSGVSHYSNLWIKRKPYIKSFRIIDKAKEGSNGPIAVSRGTVTFLYEFSGATEAYIKYYKEKTKKWERMKEIQINKRMTNSQCYLPYNNKYVAKVESTFPVGKYIKYILVIKDKNFVVSSKIVKANNVEDTGITVFDFSYYRKR